MPSVSNVNAAGRRLLFIESFEGNPYRWGIYELLAMPPDAKHRVIYKEKLIAGPFTKRKDADEMLKCIRRHDKIPRV